MLETMYAKSVLWSQEKSRILLKYLVSYIYNGNQYYNNNDVLKLFAEFDILYENVVKFKMCFNGMKFNTELSFIFITIVLQRFLYFDLEIVIESICQLMSSFPSKK